MSIPRNHHYLPKFYLDRWARDGQVFRYVRPRGIGGELHCKAKPPSAICREPDLYQMPDIDDAADSQFLETGLFQQIDDKAAIALGKFDQLQQGTREEHEALCQFVISLLYRTPTRLSALRDGLATQTEGAPYTGLLGQEYDDKLKGTTNRLLAMLVQSPDAISRFSKFKTFRITTTGASKTLLTSDRPLTVSAQMVSDDAFIIMPYAPDRLLIMTRHESIANSFASQNTNILVSGINQAIVEQSEEMIVACDKRATKMIDRLFLRSTKERSPDPSGLIRRASPMINLEPKPRKFSRHHKKSIYYLGQ